MNIQSAGYLSCHDRPEPVTAPYCRPRGWTRFYTQVGTVKPVSVQRKQQDRKYWRLIIRLLYPQLPQTHHSNPHSPKVVSRGFLP
jgi:hypothetical protein